MRSVGGGRFRFRRKLGAGSFGEIYEAKDTQTKELVAVKLESSSSKCGTLELEQKFYSVLQSGVGIPRLVWSSFDRDSKILVISRLGRSLEDLAAASGHRLSLKTVLMLADQMLSCVQFCHEKGILHRDVKPDNFLIGDGSTANQVFLIDFGLAKRYRHVRTHEHIPFLEGKSLTGTARYASLATMKGQEQSRRDDMESLGYVWLYLLRGSLPWMGLDAANRRQKYQRICQVKQDTSLEDLCSGVPDEFVQYFRDVLSLPFDGTPNYANYRTAFKKLFLNAGYVYDYIYDWTLEGVCEADLMRRPPVERLSDRANVPAKPAMAAQQYSFSKQDAVPKVPRFSVATRLSITVSDHSTDESDQPALSIRDSTGGKTRAGRPDRALTEAEPPRPKPQREHAAEDGAWSAFRRTSAYGRPPRPATRATDVRRTEPEERKNAIMSGDTSESFQSGRAVMAGAKPREKAMGKVFAQRKSMGFSSHFEEWMLEKANKSTRH
jgi:serine/threonine protein kinase